MNHFKKAPMVGAATALAAHVASAASAFYVDPNAALGGNGSLATPFRTIAEVNAAQAGTPTKPPTVLNGDAVYFKCGAAWPAQNEAPTALQLKTGVKYNSYYNSSSFPIYGCASTSTPALAKPVLRGSVKLSGLSWSTYKTNIYKADITRFVSGLGPVAQLIDPTLSGSRRMQRARYPNVGEGNYAGATSSRYLHVGNATPASSDNSAQYTMQLDPSPASATASNTIPAGTNLTGAQAYIRQYDWILSRFNVVGQANTDTITVSLDDPFHQPNYALRHAADEATGGFWLENQLWMLDSPGEWYVDKYLDQNGQARYTLYVWRADGKAPATATTYYAAVGKFGITAGMTDEAADASKVANNVSLKNIEVQDTVLDGISIMGNLNDPAVLNTLTIDGVSVSRAGRNGVVVRSARGTTPGGINTLVIRNATIQDTMKMGIDVTGSGEMNALNGNAYAWVPAAEGVDISNNSLTDIGLPFFANAAINASTDSKVMGNTINRAAARGIDAVGVRIKVSNNSIQGACTSFDDCGAIYTNGRYVNAEPTGDHTLNATIMGNVIENVGGPDLIDGRRPAASLGGVGIYLDDYAANVSVTGNTVSAADVGIFLHGTANTTVSGNQVDLSRSVGLGIGPSNVVEPVGNAITGNTILTRVGFQTPAVRLDTKQTTITNQASFSGNVYGSRYAAPFWVSTTDPVSKEFFTRTIGFAQWQAEGRDNSSGSRMYTDLPAYTPVTGLNLVANETFSTQTDDWLPYYSVADGESVTYLSASPECYANGSCVRISSTKAAPASGRNYMGFYSFKPNFTVTPGHIYMVTFDARSSNANDAVSPNLGRYGSACDADIQPNCSLSRYLPPARLSTQWKRYAFPLETAQTRTYTDGRVDLVIFSNGSVYLDNIRVVDVTRSVNPESMSFYGLFNKSKSAQSFSCGATVSANCSAYRDLSTTSAVTFPLTLNAWGHQAVYLNGSSWQDSDGDGVPDWADQSCPNTPAGAGANEKGCGIGQ